MATQKPTIRLLMEIHCRIGEAVSAALKQVGHEDRSGAKQFASVWIGTAEEPPNFPYPLDTLEQKGLVRVFGPAPIHEAEMYREKLGFALSRAGCEIQEDVSSDD